jgi:phospholipid/cholesterol/gamma-HCH transport system ATP-binding protein
MNPPIPGGVQVEVRGLRRSYQGQPVLRGLDFEVDAGEIFVVMGPSGSGKTVLLKHLIGLERPDEGEILIGGKSIDTPDFMENCRLAMVFQSGALLNSLTVGENVGLYLAEHRLKPAAEIEEIVRGKLELVGLEGQEDRYPAELSGGMKKRVAIARALVIEPQLLLYDEPTSELDPQMAVVIGEEICNLNRRIGVTSIVVSHDRDMAFGIADRLAVMHEGLIRAVGTPAEVRECGDPVIAEFLSANFKHIRKETAS